MSPQSHEKQSDFDVPAPRAEHEELQAAEISDNYVSEADANKQLEQATTASPAPATQVPPVDPASLSSAQPAAVQPAAPQTTPQPQGWMPQIADDTDLIEKEWVDKAKEIVAQTAHDPHLQYKEINKVRAEYLKKRYNKELKQGE